MKTRTTLGLLVVSLLLFGACGGDSGPGLDEYADALSQSIQDDPEDDSIEIAADEADCIGAAAADTIGIDALEEVGTPDEVREATPDDLSVFDLSDGAAVDIAGDYLDCVPSAYDQFLTLVADGDDEFAACLEDEIDADDLVPSVAASLQGDDEDDAALGDELIAAVETCVTSGEPEGSSYQDYVDALAAQILTANAGEFAYGDTEAECIAETTFDTIGEERTTALGTPDEFVAATTENLAVVGLDDAEVGIIAQGYLDCSPATAESFRAGFAIGAGLDDEQSACASDVLTEDIIVEFITASLSGGDVDAVSLKYQEAFAPCG